MYFPEEEGDMRGVKELGRGLLLVGSLVFSFSLELEIRAIISRGHQREAKEC